MKINRFARAAAGVLSAVSVFAASSAMAQTVDTTFEIFLTIEESCTVDATNIDLGTSPAITTTDIGAAGTITVTCSNTTPYDIGLTPSNDDTDGAGVLSGTTADTIAYQLRFDNASGDIWGNIVDTNTVNSVGNGAEEEFTVWAAVLAADANVTPDDYSDTVNVTVTF